MAGWLSKNLEKYIPKGGEILEENDYPVFYKLENERCAKELFMFFLITVGDQIRTDSILDPNTNPFGYYQQGLQFYFDDQTSDSYHDGYYKVGREILREFRDLNSKNIVDRGVTKSLSDLSQMFSAHLHLKTAYKNADTVGGRGRCHNTTVGLIGIDIESKRYHNTSNYLNTIVSSCTLQKQSKLHNKRVSASDNKEVCNNVCQHQGCSEIHFLKKCEESNFLDPRRSFCIFTYDDETGCCKTCDLAMRKAGVPIVTNAFQPGIVYINQKAPLYKRATNEIQSTIGNRLKSRLF